MNSNDFKTTQSDIKLITKYPRSKRLRRSLQFGAVTVALLSASGAWIKSDRQDTARLSTDTRIIVRFPKAVFAKLTQDEIREEFPILEQSGGMEISGQAVAKGQVSIEIEADSVCHSDDHAVIAVRVVGETEKSLVGQQSNVTIQGTGRGQFNALKKIHFDGREFQADGDTVVTASHETEIENVETSVGGAFRLLASRKARAAVPSVNEIAVARIQQRVAERVDEIVANLLPQLNISNRLNDAISRLHPAASGWRIQMTATKDLVQAALIPHGGLHPELPSSMSDNVEVWMRLTPSQRIGMNLLNLGDQSHLLISKILPEATARQMTDQLRIASVDDWTLLEIAESSLIRDEV